MSNLKEYDIFELVGKTKENLRKLMARTVEAYPTEWIVIHEALQNARDAIQQSELSEGEINVFLDLTNQSVTIVDNGVGFTRDITLLGIGGTDKESLDWKIQGNQGVGLKAVLLSTSEFKLESVKDGKKWTVTCKNASEYKNGADVKIVEHPVVDVTAPNGTKISYKFSDKRLSSLLKYIWELGRKMSRIIAPNNHIKLKKAIEWYFRSYSYAGDVNRLLDLAGIKPIVTKFKITYSEDVPAEFDNPLSGILENIKDEEIIFPNIHWNIHDAVNMVPPRQPKPPIVEMDPPDGGKFTGFSSNVIWVAKYTTPDQYKLLLRNSGLRVQPDSSEYETLFENTLGIYIVIGGLETLRDFFIENPRRFVAANGIPSSHLIRDPTKGGELTYNRNIHFIINLNSRLNYGKQNITNTRLLGKAFDFYTDAYRATLKNIAKSIVGTEAVDLGGGGYYDRIADKDRNILEREGLIIPTGLGSLSIKKVPKDENTVIALFFELMGKGILKDFNVYSLHGKSRYDCRMMIKHSGMQEMPTPESDSDLAVVEFKQRTSDLIDDFENDRKISGEIHLLIAWENDFEENTGYQVVDIEYTPDDSRRFFGVKSSLKDKMSGWHIQMFILKDFLEELTNNTQ